jgi:uncharacterized protein YjiS (DUF1127 family)
MPGNPDGHGAAEQWLSSVRAPRQSENRRSVMTSRTAETLERGLAASMTAGGFVSRTIEVILYWRDLARGRRHLAALNDEMLRDIGLTRADVEREYRKPFWQS